MKRVLIPTVFFHPLNHIATFRSVSMAKYLPEYGWEPIVVTPKWTESQVKQRLWFWNEHMVGKDPCPVERFEFLIREQLGFHYFDDFLAHLHGSVHEYRDGTLFQSLLDKSREVCNLNKIDAVYASSGPEYIHAVADTLHHEFGIPWIADHRDIADQEKLFFRNYFRNPLSILPLYYFLTIAASKMEVRNNIKHSRSAAVITTVSEGLAEKLRKRNKPPVHVIMNGFDPDDFIQSPEETNNEIFTIIYTGSIWGPSNPDPFLQGIDLLLTRYPEMKSTFQTVFYGSSSEGIKNFTKNMENRDNIRSGGFLSHAEMINRMFKADLLYLISHPCKGIVTGKIFEYLASGRPILSVPGDGDITDSIISETKSGMVASTPEEVVRVVYTLYLEWKKNGRIDIQQNRKEVNKYTRKDQAKELANLLDSIT